MIYAIIDAVYYYAERGETTETSFTIPLSMGIMTASQARKLARSDVLEAAELALIGSREVEIYGLCALRPDAERRGQRFSERKKRGSKGNRGAGRGGPRRKGRASKAVKARKRPRSRI